MLTKLKLEQFKNFRDTSLQLGPFTLLVGANAAGKSNLRDAFRFLHGVARGYTLAEIFGEKWVESGVLQWRGIRGGVRDVAFLSAPRFALEIDFVMQYKFRPRTATYRIEVAVGGRAPLIVGEQLKLARKPESVFYTSPIGQMLGLTEPGFIDMQLSLGKQNQGRVFTSRQPVISQLAYESGMPASFSSVAIKALEAMRSWRFHDLDVDAMRQPSVPGQTILGDRGENLSSVLLAICEEENRRKALVEWLRALTPIDATDLDFYTDAAGRVLVQFVEANGHKTSAYSASDGTLRFLAMLAALLGPSPAAFYVFDEIETGIHPTRLHLLVQLIEQQARERGIQVVATTHSPQLLAMLSKPALEQAALVYRLPEAPDGQIKRLVDIPDLPRLMNTQGLADLHSMGWLEDAMFFARDEGEE